MHKQRDAPARSGGCTARAAVRGGVEKMGGLRQSLPGTRRPAQRAGRRTNRARAASCSLPSLPHLGISTDRLAHWLALLCVTHAFIATKHPTSLPLPNPTHRHHLSAGRYHSVALASNGALYTWGCGENGQLGHNSGMGNCCFFFSVASHCYQ